MKKVLVVGRSDISRSLLYLYLSLHFPHVVIVGSGEEAMGKLKKEKFDLLISDFEMGTSSDFWLLEKLKDLEGPPLMIILSQNHLILEEIKRRGGELPLKSFLSFEEFTEYIQKIRGD